MTNSQIIKIENEEINKVDQYKYLGKTVKLNDHTREIDNNYQNTKDRLDFFGGYKENLCDQTDQKLPMSLRI